MEIRVKNWYDCYNKTSSQETTPRVGQTRLPETADYLNVDRNVKISHRSHSNLKVSLEPEEEIEKAFVASSENTKLPSY